MQFLHSTEVCCSQIAKFEHKKMKINCNKDIKDFLCFDIGTEVFFMENNHIVRGEIESLTLSRSVLQSDVLHIEYKVKGYPQKFSGMYQDLFPTIEALVAHIKPR